jgi:O-antigen ligase
MRRVVLTVAGALLLSGSTALAFFSGGYYAEPRLIAAIAVWALILALTLTGEPPLPRTLPGRLALGGLVLLTIWSALSVSWAPLRGPAIEAVERLVLYSGVLLLAVGVLRTRAALRMVEPALAAGATVVIGYGLAGRLLPGIVHLDRSRSAGGRLEQPITYWNAEGALAAVGLVLCARLVADRTRARSVRIAAAAATAPLGTGVYLSYSRGALAIAALGLLVLVAAEPTYRQLRASVLALAAAAAGAAVAAALPGVAALEGSTPERDGAIALVALVALAGGAGLLAARSRAGPDRALRHASRLAPAAGIVAAAVAVGLVVAGLGERPTAAELAAGARAGRLTTTSSNRYEYWRVGLNAFQRHPLTGLGAAGFRVEWLRERSIREAVRDVHSLEIEMAAELGIVGLIALALLIGGVAAAAADALRRHPSEAAGASAALLAWLLHASIDWHWQLPAVSLPAIVLAGMLIVLAEVPTVSGAAR